MNRANLPADTQARLDELIAEILQVLNSSQTPHLDAVSDSSMPDGARQIDALVGGSIRAPSKPPFVFNKGAISALHRALLQSGDGVLYGVVVGAHRADPQSPWQIQTKLVSRAEYKEIAKGRKPIDAEVESHLRRFAGERPWERLSFGRDMPKKEPTLSLKNTDGLQHAAPTPELLGLLERAESLYENYGLRLMIAYWTLRSSGLEFREYFE